MNERDGTLRHEIKQGRGFGSRAQEASIAILRTADVLRRRLGAVVEPRGITLQQYNVLRILRGARGEPMPTLEIAERLIERTPGVTRLLDRLEEKGLVRRERGQQDRRRVHCWITDAGLALLAELDPAMDEADVASARGLDQAELRELIRMLERVRVEPG